MKNISIFIAIVKGSKNIFNLFEHLMKKTKMLKKVPTILFICTFQFLYLFFLSYENVWREHFLFISFIYSYFFFSVKQCSQFIYEKAFSAFEISVLLLQNVLFIIIIMIFPLFFCTFGDKLWKPVKYCHNFLFLFALLVY